MEMNMVHFIKLFDYNYDFDKKTESKSCNS